LIIPFLSRRIVALGIFRRNFFRKKLRRIKGDARTKPAKVNIDYRHLPLLSSS